LDIFAVDPDDHLSDMTTDTSGDFELTGGESEVNGERLPKVSILLKEPSHDFLLFQILIDLAETSAET